MLKIYNIRNKLVVIRDNCKNLITSKCKLSWK